MVSALWSNSAFDEADDKNARQGAISRIESGYEEALQAIANASPGEQEEEEQIDKNNPFFAAAERGMKKFDDQVAIAKPITEDEMDYLKGLDQAD